MNTTSAFSWNENSADIPVITSQVGGVILVLSLTHETKVWFNSDRIVHSEFCRRNIWESTAIILRYEWIQHFLRAPIHKRGWQRSLRWQCFYSVFGTAAMKGPKLPLSVFMAKAPGYSCQHQTSIKIENEEIISLLLTETLYNSLHSCYLHLRRYSLMLLVTTFITRRNDNRWSFWVLATSSQWVSDVCNIQHIHRNYHQFIRSTSFQIFLFSFWVGRKELRQSSAADYNYLLHHIDGTENDRDWMCWVLWLPSHSKEGVT
jgi:hypothetical protein